MLVQARNQANRECLYAWYPEPVTNSSPIPPRDIYILNGIDKTLLVERCKNSLSSVTTLPFPALPLLATNTDETLKSDSKERFAYTAETIDEALRTPWALDYEIKRRPATPNLPSAPPSVSKLETQQKSRLKTEMITRLSVDLEILSLYFRLQCRTDDDNGSSTIEKCPCSTFDTHRH